jgi:hypothetical protein
VTRAGTGWLSSVGLAGLEAEEQQRIDRVAALAPALLPALGAAPALTAEIAAGTVRPPSARVPSDADLGAWAEDARLRALARWALSMTGSPGPELAAVYDALARALLAQLQPEVGLIALGRYAAQELGPSGDADCLLAGAVRRKVEPARVLSFVRAAARLPEPIGFDFGPPGPNRVFVRGGQGPQEGWRRLVWTRLRLVQGSSRGCLAAWESVPKGWAREDSKVLAAYWKGRLRSTVPGQLVARETKLAPGGLAEGESVLAIGFLVAGEPSVPPTGFSERVSWAVRAGWLDDGQAKALDAAVRFLSDVSARSELLGYGPAIVPENPDKLALVAEETGLGGANEVLKELGRCREAVREVSEACLARL